MMKLNKYSNFLTTPKTWKGKEHPHPSYLERHNPSYLSKPQNWRKHESCNTLRI